MKKICLTCVRALDTDCFYRNSHNKKDFLDTSCKECCFIYNKKYYKGIRIRVLEKYGNRCECCGESTTEFLCIDHINKDGADERRTGLQGSRFYRWLDINPKLKNYRLLCNNCNMSIGMNGYCPHSKNEPEVSIHQYSLDTERK